MKKPLKNWTLGEVKSFCAGHDRCDGCALERKEGGGCKLADEPPCEWNLGEKRRFTVQEAEKAMALKTLFPDAIYVFVGGEWCEITVPAGDKVSTHFIVSHPYEWFPSAKVGEQVLLADIIGGGK